MLPWLGCRSEVHLLTIALFVQQIAGTLGTGLFLGSGKTLRIAGPLGALLAYILVGTVAYSYVSSFALPLNRSVSHNTRIVHYVPSER